MYSYEDRLKAVKLLIKYDMSIADTVRILGYPNRKMLAKWYKEYLKSGDLHQKYTRKPKYSLDQMRVVVDYYIEHGRSLTRTIKVFGYPSREILTKWIDELLPGNRKITIRRSSMIQFSEEQKKDAVIKLCSRSESAAVVAKKLGTSRCNLYNWRIKLLGKEGSIRMKKPKNQPLTDNSDVLNAEIEMLTKQIYRQQMELDILNKTVDIIKKDPGIDPKNLTNKEKFNLVDALKNKYLLHDLLRMIDMAKSTYYYQLKAQKRPDKYTELRMGIKEVFSESKNCYGYRRIHAEIKHKGIVVSEKVIRKIMKQELLIIHYKKKRRYNSYLGEISPAVENVIERDFRADAPNTKWLTDITEFHIPSGKVYLSPIVDCFDGMIVSWSIGTSPDAELVNVMLDDAIKTLSDGEYPIVHSDRGGHYRWPGWISRMDNARLTRSMSKKGCSPDNSACEGFFGRLKNEIFYSRSWNDISIDQFIDELDNYLKWYNEKRIKMSLGAMSPVSYRRSLGYAV